MRNEWRLRVVALIVLLLVLAAGFAPLIARIGGFLPAPDTIDLAQRLSAPSRAHPLGTDELGRDVASRMLHGARVSLAAGIGASFLSFLLGTALGLFGGSGGRLLDAVVVRLIETFLCFPFFFLVLAIVALTGPSLQGVIIALALTSWPTEARLVRGEALRAVRSDFVLAAHAAGASRLRLIVNHVLPHAVAPAIVSSTFTVGTAILSEAALSYLGLGVPLPTASWGNMMAGAETELAAAWWLLLFPGSAIFITALTFYVAGDALRELLDPQRIDYEPLLGNLRRNDSRTTGGTRSLMSPPSRKTSLTSREET